MAGDWMKMELDLPDKPEVYQIASILNMEPDAVVGKLFRAWAWFDKHTEDGNAHSVTFALVDRITSVTGFGEAMQFAGWLEQDGHTLRMPNFDRHNGKSAKKRALTAKRQSNHRVKSNADDNANSNARSVTPASPEKRREEKSIKGASAPPSSVTINGQWHEWAKKNDISLNLQVEADKCFDYYRGKGRRQKDWDAVLRNWFRKAQEYRNDKSPQQADPAEGAI